MDQVARSKKWQSMIATCIAKGQHREALQAYDRMQLDQLVIVMDEHEHRSLLVKLVGCCAHLKDEAQGQRLHAQIASWNLDKEARLGTALLTMYGKLGRVEAAKNIFDGVLTKDVVCWNAMLAAFARSGSPRRALDLFYAGINVWEATAVTYASVLTACSRCKDLAQGMAIHSRIMQTTLSGATLVLNALVWMYVSCQRMDAARRLFESIQVKSIVSWNSMLAGYARHADSSQILDMYSRMVRESLVEPDAVTFTIVLGACSRLEALQQGRDIHARIRSSRNHLLEIDSFVQVALVDMYAKCGDVEAAKQVFDASESKRKNVVLWNAMIVACSRRGWHRQALQLYTKLEVEGLVPDEVTVACAVSCCATLELLEAGEWILRTAPETVLSSTIVQNAAVNLYSKCGELRDAQDVFDGIKQKSVVSWTGIIGGYARQGQSSVALTLYRKMSLEGVQPNEATLATVLAACSSQEFLGDGMKIHSSLEGGNFESAPVVDTAVITMYGSCGRADLARDVLDRHSISGDGGCVAAWNAAIGAYVQQGHTQEACQLYMKMTTEKQVHPNDRTLSTVLPACDLESGKRIHDTLQAKSVKPSAVVQTALLNMYGKCGSLESARKIFEDIPLKDVVCWNAMVAAASQCGDPSASRQLYHQMNGEGVKPEASTFVSLLGACSSSGDLKAGEMVHCHAVSCGLASLAAVAVAIVNMYAKCGRMELARETFYNRLGDSNNSVAWNSMLSLCAHHGHGAEALEMFMDMVHKGIKVTEASLTSVLVGSSHSGLYPLGRSIVVNAIDDHNVVPCVDHFVCMVDLLARSGMVHDAEQLILGMPFESPSAAWVSLLCGCRDQRDFVRGLRAALHILMLDPHSTVPYNLLVVPSSNP